MKKKNMPLKALFFSLLVSLIFSNCYVIDSEDADTYNKLTRDQLISKNSVIFNGETYKMGLIPASDDEYESFPRLIAAPMATLPSSVDLSSKLPNVGNQGRQGSCVAWATGYAYKTFQEGLDRGWNVINDTSHQFSPAYIYNQINGGQDNGTFTKDALALIENQGCATLSSMPYNQNDYRTQPNSSQKQNAAQYKAKKWWRLDKGDVAAMKTQIANGDAIVVEIPVYSDFDVSSSNPVYDNTNGTLGGYHAIAFCGYDDGKKAFKLINSWGTRWGFSGYGWMSYDLISRLGIRSYAMQDIDDVNSDPDPDPDPDPAEASIKILKATYNIGERIIVTYSNLPGNSTDWIGLYQKGASDTSRITYKYTNGAKNGTMTFTGLSNAGEYAARLFFNDSYILEDRVSFIVSDPVPATSFTLVVIPDSQKMVGSDNDGTPAMFINQVKWIKENVDALNITFVSHVGDITDDSSSYQWTKARKAMYQLDDIVPYAIAPGNHDGSGVYSSFNDTFPYSKYSGYSWYAGGYRNRNHNSYQLFSAGGMDFIIIHLAFAPNSSERAWASGVLDGYPDRRAIISTHSFQGTSGMTPEGSSIWADVVKNHKNVFMVICGHIHAQNYSTYENNFGGTVHVLLTDYQSNSPQVGRLRYYTFKPEENAVYAYTYSTERDAYYTNSKSKFKFTYHMSAGPDSEEYADAGVAFGDENTLPADDDAPPLLDEYFVPMEHSEYAE